MSYEVKREREKQKITCLLSHGKGLEKGTNKYKLSSEWDQTPGYGTEINKSVRSCH